MSRHSVFSKYLLRGIAVALALLVVAASGCVSKTEYEKLQAQLGQAQQELSSRQAEIVRVNSALSQEQNRVSDLSSQLSVVQDKAAALQKQLSDLNLLADAQKQEFSRLTSDLTKANNTNASLDQQISAVKADLSKANSANQSLSQQMDSLRAELAQTKSAVNALKGLASPAAGPKGASGSSASSVSLGDGFTLTYEPAQPVTGRSIRFAVDGLSPWATAAVTFVNPVGAAVDWVDENDTFYTGLSSPEHLKSRTFVADSNGKISWIRTNALDPEGQWTAQIGVNGRNYVARYSLTPLQLQTSAVSKLGLSLRRYSGGVSDVYATAGIPLASALDLSSTLYFIGEGLKPSFGVSYVAIPDVYLFLDQDLFNTALASMGKTPNGFESGMYMNGKYRGIYIIADPFMSESVKTLVHEYTHLLVDESAPNVQVPAWLNEGMAKYMELTIGPQFGATLSAQREIFARADSVQKRAAANALFPLKQLESLKSWNAQTNRDLFSLQYSEAYMAVRYMSERFGSQSVSAVLAEMNKGQSFDAAFQKVTGASLAAFERDWLTWVDGWKDSNREQVRSYVDQVKKILDDVSSLSKDRENYIRASGSISFSARAATQSTFVDRATALENTALSLKPPDILKGFNADLTAFLSVLKKWLQTELDAFQQGSNATLDKANAMIPEVDGRENRANSQLPDIEYNWGLNP